MVGNAINGDHNISVNERVYRSIADPAAFVQVDLGGDQTLGRVQLWARRSAGIETRYDGQVLTVLDASATTIYEGPIARPAVLTEPYGINFSPPLANARAVKISYAAGAPNPILTFGELEALASHATAPGISIITDLANLSGPVLENQAITFGPVVARVDGGVRASELSYRWYRNGVLIPAAQGTSYTTAPVTVVGNDL